MVFAVQHNGIICPLFYVSRIFHKSIPCIRYSIFPFYHKIYFTILSPYRGSVIIIYLQITWSLPDILSWGDNADEKFSVPLGKICAESGQGFNWVAYILHCLGMIKARMVQLRKNTTITPKKDPKNIPQNYNKFRSSIDLAQNASAEAAFHVPETQLSWLSFQYGYCDCTLSFGLTWGLLSLYRFRSRKVYAYVLCCLGNWKHFYPLILWCVPTAMLRTGPI